MHGLARSQQRGGISARLALDHHADDALLGWQAVVDRDDRVLRDVGFRLGAEPGAGGVVADVAGVEVERERSVVAVRPVAPGGGEQRVAGQFDAFIQQGASDRAAAQRIPEAARLLVEEQ